MSVNYADIFAEAAAPPAAGAVLHRISDVPPQKLSWLWPGRIPLGKLTLFSGDPGLGKSLVTLDIASRVTCKRAWPDGAPNEKSGSVVLLSSEDDAADTIRPRLEAANADLTRIHILEAVRRPKQDGTTTLDQFNLQDDITALQDAITKLEDVRLVIIDPISAYLGKTDSHVTAKVRGLLAPLIAAAQTLRFSVIFLEHLNKSNLKAMYRSSGSIGFIAAARAAWCFGQDPDEPEKRLMLPVKMNLAPGQKGLSYRVQESLPDVPAVVWGEAVTVTADAILQPESTDERSERMGAMDWLRNQLANGPVSAKQILADARGDYSEITLRRAKKALGVIAQKDGFAQGWSWQLPEGDHETPKVLTLLEGAPSAQVITFDVPAQGYIPDSEGCGVTCKDCGHHFGTPSGWKYHKVGGRCDSKFEAAD
jgi:putative DNA primase/helicase